MEKFLNLPPKTISLCFTVAVLAVFGAAFLVFPTVAPGSKPELTTELMREYGFVGSYDQRSAYVLSFITIVILSTASFFIAQRRLVQTAQRLAVPAINIWICVLITIVGLLVYGALVPNWIVGYATILAAGFFCFVFWAPYIRRHTVEFVTLLLIGAYLSIVVVPGLLISPIPFPVSDANSVAQIELHLQTLVQPGSAIAAGANFFREIPFSYGLLMPSIVSVIDHRFGPMTVADHVRFVQFCQVAFSLIAALAYFCYRPRSYLGVLAALLLAAPYWTSAGLGIWHPNQTGLRSLTLPLGILAMTLAGRCRPNTAAWGLGAVGGIALLINIETAAAVGAGYVVYFVLRTRRVPLVPIFRMAIAVTVIACLYLILYRIALGRLPFSANLANIFFTLRQHITGSAGLRLFTSGYVSEGYYIVPFAFVMLAHAIYVVFAAFQRLGTQPLSHRQALRPAIATVLIVWLAYYFNMPNWWQIWTHLFLYGFLLIDLFDLRLLAVGTALRDVQRKQLRRRMVRSRIARLIPIFFLAVLIPHTNHHLIFYLQSFIAPDWTKNAHDTELVSGMVVPRAVGEALKEKTKKLLELNAATGGKVRYLTYNIEFVPMLSRLFEPTPTRNLWSIGGDDALDPAIDAVFASPAAAILIDAPTGPLAVGGTRKDFQDRVRRSVGREYYLAETTLGWEIYRPKPVR